MRSLRLLFPHCFLLYNSTRLPSLSPLCFSIKLNIFFSLSSGKKKKKKIRPLCIYNHSARRKRQWGFCFSCFSTFFCVFIWSDELRSGWLLRDYYIATHDVPRMKFYREKRAWWVSCDCIASVEQGTWILVLWLWLSDSPRVLFSYPVFDQRVTLWKRWYVYPSWSTIMSNANVPKWWFHKFIWSFLLWCKNYSKIRRGKPLNLHLILLNFYKFVHVI